MQVMNKFPGDLRRLETNRVMRVLKDNSSRDRLKLMRLIFIGIV